MVSNSLGGVSYLVDWSKHYHHIVADAIEGVEVTSYQVLSLFTEINLDGLSPPAFSISVEELVEEAASLQVWKFLPHSCYHYSKCDTRKITTINAVQAAFNSPESDAPQGELKRCLVVCSHDTQNIVATYAAIQTRLGHFR